LRGFMKYREGSALFPLYYLIFKGLSIAYTAPSSIGG
jgi:hypothetical protein